MVFRGPSEMDFDEDSHKNFVQTQLIRTRIYSQRRMSCPEFWVTTKSSLQ